MSDDESRVIYDEEEPTNLVEHVIKTMRLSPEIADQLRGVRLHRPTLESIREAAIELRGRASGKLVDRGEEVVVDLPEGARRLDFKRRT
jgi:hypothetical protein